MVPNFFGQYQKAEENSYIIPRHCINITFTGLIYQYVGEKINQSTEPYVSFHMKGEQSKFAYDKNRENWVLQFDKNIFKNTSDQSNISMEILQESIMLPRLIKIPAYFVSELKSELNTMLLKFYSPLKEDKINVQLGLFAILKNLIQFSTNNNPLTPAQQLKKLIDHDHGFEQSLEHLSQKIPISNDHLRILFHQAYECSPQQYRNHLRMQKALDLICHSQLQVAEIGISLGYQQTSHFCTSFKKHFGNTPKEYINQFRHKQNLV